MSAGLAPRLNFASQKKTDLDYSQFGSLLSEFQVTITQLLLRISFTFLFQIEKLKYFFQQFFDQNGDGVISVSLEGYSFHTDPHQQFVDI